MTSNCTPRKEHYVYFAEACGKIKIGCSNDPQARIAGVGEWIPFPITMLATIKGSYDLEAVIHAQFDAEWSHGEWFDASPRLIAFVQRVAAGEPVVIDTSARSERRRGFIADKKRLTHAIHRLWKAGGDLPSEIAGELEQVKKGQPIPPALLSKANAYITAFLAERAA